MYPKGSEKNLLGLKKENVRMCTYLYFYLKRNTLIFTDI